MGYCIDLDCSLGYGVSKTQATAMLQPHFLETDQSARASGSCSLTTALPVPCAPLTPYVNTYKATLELSTLG